MDKKMTVEEAKKAKADLEIKMLSLIKEFEKGAGMTVSYVNIKTDHGEHLMCGCGERPDSVSLRPSTGIKDLTVEVEFDRMVRVKK